MKIKTAVKDYLVEIEIRKYTPRTLKSYKTILNIFQRFCEEEMEITDIEDVDMATVKRFTQTMMRNGKKGTYINGCLKTIKSFIQYCYEEDFGGFNTRRGGFKWVKEERPVIKAFTPKDVRLMLDNCKGIDYLDLRDAAILTLLFETGVRCLETCHIKNSDIHDDYIVINGKNHKQRVVPITPILKKAMMRYERARDNYFMYRDREEFYFLSYSGKGLTNAAMEYLIKKRGKGITGVRVSPHTCRHTFAQQQLKMGVDLYTISRLLGHENVSITQIYLNSLQDEEVIKIAKQNSVLMNM